MFKTLFLSGREYSYQRNEVILRALSRLGDVDVCSIARGSLLSRSLYSSLCYFARSRQDYDFLSVGFYGHLIMTLVGIVSHLPILFDVFLSTFDTLCFDRKILSPNSFGGKLAYYLDLLACKRASLLLLDTNAHIQYFVETFKIPSELFFAIPVGCNEDVFYPRYCDKPSSDFIVLYYCSYQPLHGVDVVLQSAKHLEKYSRIKFRLVGSGPMYSYIRSYAERLEVKNIEFVPYLPLEQLALEIVRSDLCLGGHFGRSDKAQRVIPGKVYQILACEKPVIVSDTVANRELLTDGENAVFCQIGDPQDLAEKILMLFENEDCMLKLAKNGRSLYLEKCSEEVITGMIRKVIGQVVG